MEGVARAVRAPLHPLVLYLATVIDIASRRVVGWVTAEHLRTDLVADALNEHLLSVQEAGVATTG
ncbi:hypothetical protein [Streptomyces sp. NPDC005181]|uniref:hypothetical protein n=1 Tax=Streptomyces sp. NPDC005181 TaxID=3156869 RepID=UPI0033A67083